MGNIIESFASGLGSAIGNLFRDPLDFLSGKSCSSNCGTTWDILCYVENFCVANLLKLALVFLLFYIVVLFLYISYKLGICQCIGRSLCGATWACFSACFYVWKYTCCFLFKPKPKPAKRSRLRHVMTEMEDFDSFFDDEDDNDLRNYPGAVISMRRSSPVSRRWRKCNRKGHIRRSLRPRSHRYIKVAVVGTRRGRALVCSAKRRHHRKLGYCHGRKRRGRWMRD